MADPTTPSAEAVASAVDLLPMPEEYDEQRDRERERVALALDAALARGREDGRRAAQADALARLEDRRRVPGVPLVLFEDVIREVIHPRRDSPHDSPHVLAHDAHRDGVSGGGDSNHKCRACEGTGDHPLRDAKGQTCDACHGTGHLPTPDAGAPNADK